MGADRPDGDGLAEKGRSREATPVTMEAERTLPAEELTRLGELAAQLRVDSIRCSTRAGSGHPTSSLSAAELLAVLISRHLRYDWADPHGRANDHLIFSKGHASPLLYAVFKAAGVISDEELVETYRQFGSRLQGHPTPVLPWVDVATGSLGQGLPAGVGIALAGRHLDHLPFHVWALCGDSEMAEGSIWEALDKAGHYGLHNLTAIVDVNRFGQRGPTELEWDLDTYRRRVEAFGCQALVIDGHDLAAIDEALGRARQATGPTVVLARTVKGKGVPEVENKPGWHGKPLEPDWPSAPCRPGWGPPDPGPARRPCPPRPPTRHRAAARAAPVRQGREGGHPERVRRRAAGAGLAAGRGGPGRRGQRLHPRRQVRRGVPRSVLRDVHLGAADGRRRGRAAGRGYRPFASTFAAFLSRAYDFIRMAGVSRADIALSGSHAGVEIGADGPSQMGLEDLAAMRAVQGSTVLYPSDAVSCAALVAGMVDRKGVNYLRTTRGKYPVLYDNGDASRSAAASCSAVATTTRSR